MNRVSIPALRRLQALARIKADAETARLAVTAQSRDRLRAALSSLGQGEPPLQAVIPPEGVPPVSSAQPAAAAKPEPAGGQTPLTEHAPDIARIVDPALVRARLAHGVWIEVQRAHLNARLAMVEADWRRLHPVAAQAVGRVQVLDELADRAVIQAKYHRTRRDS